MNVVMPEASLLGNQEAVEPQGVHRAAAVVA